VTDSVGWVSRSYYSIGWLTAADIMKANAEEVGGGQERPDQPVADEMRAYVLSAVTASAAFLDAHINELFDDAHEYRDDPASPLLRGLHREAQIRMAALWPHVKMYRIMEKYAIALDLAEADPFDRGAEPAQSVEDLRRVRNHYIHYQPDSVRNGVAEGDDKKLSNRMQGKIKLPDWDEGSVDVFPTRALCPDLARWAVESVVRFADAFCDRLRVTRNYDHVRPGWLRQGEREHD